MSWGRAFNLREVIEKNTESLLRNIVDASPSLTHIVSDGNGYRQVNLCCSAEEQFIAKDGVLWDIMRHNTFCEADCLECVCRWCDHIGNW